MCYTSELAGEFKEKGPRPSVVPGTLHVLSKHLPTEGARKWPRSEH